MGATKDYLEYLTVEFEREQFERLCQTNNLTTSDYKIKKIEVPEFPYQESEKWKNQKSISDKEYKKLKQIEYDLRHKPSL